MIETDQNNDVISRVTAGLQKKKRKWRTSLVTNERYLNEEHEVLRIERLHWSREETLLHISSQKFTRFI